MPIWSHSENHVNCRTDFVRQASTTRAGSSASLCRVRIRLDAGRRRLLGAGRRRSLFALRLLLTGGAMRRKAGMAFKTAPQSRSCTTIGDAVLAARIGWDIGHDDLDTLEYANKVDDN